MALWPAHNARCLYQNAIPAIPLTLTACVTSRLFFTDTRHKTREHNSSAENGKKEQMASKGLTGTVSVCLIHHGDFHRLIPIHQNKTAQSRISPLEPRFPTGAH